MTRNTLIQTCGDWLRVMTFTGLFFTAVYSIVLGPPALDSLLLAIEANAGPVMPDAATLALINQPAHTTTINAAGGGIRTVAQARQ